MSDIVSLARAVVRALNDRHPEFLLPSDIEKAVELLDQTLLDYDKTAADSPEYIEHAKKVAGAFEDFDVDANPEVQTVEGEPNVRWISCWMRVTKNPETGAFS